MTARNLYGVRPVLIVHSANCTRPAPVFSRSFFTGRPECRCPECDAHTQTQPKDEPPPTERTAA